MARKRVKPKLEDETLVWVNCIRPDNFAKYVEVGSRSIEAYVAGWLHWCTRKDHLRPNGDQYNICSPWARTQARLWMQAGMPYEYNGGTEETEAEHDRVEKGIKPPARRRKAPPLQKTSRRRRRTAS